MATYYVDGAVGNDGNLGTSEGAGNAWATIDKAMNEVAAGDKVWVKASATYTETATIDTAGGEGSTPIIFEGYTSSPGDHGKVTIDAEDTRPSCVADSILTGIHYVFRNFILKNSTGDGADLSSHQIMWENCEFNDNAGMGCDGGNGQTWVECIFSGNGGHGAKGGTTCAAMGCRFLGNTSDGIRIDFGTVIDSVFYNNGTYAIYFTGANGYHCIAYGNTIDGNGKSTATGVLFPSSYYGPHVMINNIIYDCVNGVTGRDQGERLISRNNLLYSNTTDYGSGYQTFQGEVTGAPQFTDEGSQDYTLGSESPAVNAGFDASVVSGDTQCRDMGAHESAISIECDYPSEDDVRDGVTYDTEGMEGNLVVPNEGDVQDGTGFGANGTEYEGTLELPAVGDVEDGVTYGAGGSEYEGTFGVPGEGDVRDEVGYGEDGTEFTGTLVVGGGGGGGVSGIKTGGRL